MDSLLQAIIISARPRQWLKNVSLFTALVFSGWLFLPDKFVQVFMAVGVFCILTSAVYIFNDITDLPRDRVHPLKKNRPIASGRLPMPIALFVAIVMITISLWLAIQLSFIFFFLCLGYVSIHFAYSLKLKQYPIIDVMTIAAGFIIRVYSGAVVINAHINVWLLLCIVSFSLFLAIGKRRSEKTLLEGKKNVDSRKVLSHYPETLLNNYTAMFATASWLTYALFTFQQPVYIQQGHVLSLMAILPKAFVNQKLLMITVPLVIYGVMRYLQLIYEQNKGESPEEVLMNDKALLSSVVVWGMMVVVIMYGIG